MSRLATRYLTNRIPRTEKARIQTPPATPPICAASFLFCPVSDCKGEIKFDNHDYYHCLVFVPPCYYLVLLSFVSKFLAHDNDFPAF